jgi:hypothetical protein
MSELPSVSGLEHLKKVPNNGLPTRAWWEVLFLLDPIPSFVDWAEVEEKSEQ